MDELSTMASAPFVIINHPRTPGMGTFQRMQSSPFNPRSPGPFDAIEVNASLGDWTDYIPDSDKRIERSSRAGGRIPAMLDWFGWLNSGRFVTGVGASDSHRAENGTCHPRTYVRRSLQRATNHKEQTRALIQSLREQQAVVSRGLFLDVTIYGKQALGPANMRAVQRDALVPLRVKLEGPSWVNANWITVYSMGRPLTFVRGPEGWVQKQSKHGTYVIPVRSRRRTGVRFNERIWVRATEDAWFVVVAGGKERSNPVFEGPPFAFTNPIYLDLGGNGFNPENQGVSVN
jgi:hypothetical protein